MDYVLARHLIGHCQPPGAKTQQQTANSLVLTELPRVLREAYSLSQPQRTCWDCLPCFWSGEGNLPSNTFVRRESKEEDGCFVVDVKVRTTSKTYTITYNYMFSLIDIDGEVEDSSAVVMGPVRFSVSFVHDCSKGLGSLSQPNFDLVWALEYNGVVIEKTTIKNSSLVGHILSLETHDIESNCSTSSSLAVEAASNALGRESSIVSSTAKHFIRGSVSSGSNRGSVASRRSLADVIPPGRLSSVLFTHEALLGNSGDPAAAAASVMPSWFV